MSVCLHHMDTTLHLPAAGGVDADEVETPAVVVITGFDPYDPAIGLQVEIEIHDTTGTRRRDWERLLGMDALVQLSDWAAAHWVADIKERRGESLANDRAYQYGRLRA